MVPDDRRADGGQVNPDLVLAACNRFRFDQPLTRIAIEDPDIRPSRNACGARRNTTVLAHQDGQVYREGRPVIDDRPVHERDVGLRHFPACEAPTQVRVRVLMLGEQNDAGRARVQPMVDERAVTEISLDPLGEAFPERVRGSVRRETRRLVHREQPGVFEEDARLRIELR